MAERERGRRINKKLERHDHECGSDYRAFSGKTSTATTNHLYVNNIYERGNNSTNV